MRDIVIWGTGTVARGLYYKIARDGNFKVRYFIDNAPVRSFYDCDVYLPTRENCSKYLVVVASNIHYKEISVQLLEYGLEELRDFIPYQALGREVVLVHGNCFKIWIQQYLQTSRTFNDRYWIYPIPRVYHIREGYIKDHLVKNCDVLISQDIQENNKFDERLSFSYLSAMATKRVICIPNVYGLGKFLFPQAELGKGDGWKNPAGPELENGLFLYSDENIDRLWNSGERNADVIARYLETDIYSRESIENNRKICFEKWEERDQYCDVKIMDYIKAEYKKQLLFYEPANPCNNVLRRISEGILELLDIDRNEVHEIEERKATLEMPVYRCVKEALGLEYEQGYVREVPSWELSKIVSGNMDLKEYCREYCYWCHDGQPEIL